MGKVIYKVTKYNIFELKEGTDYKEYKNCIMEISTRFTVPKELFNTLMLDEDGACIFTYDSIEAKRHQIYINTI